MKRKPWRLVEEPRSAGGYLSVKEAALAAQLPSKSLVKAIARGQLNAVIGHPAQPNTWIVHSKDLETWLGASA